MFDLGFIKDIRYVLRRLPPLDQRQSLMFSATLSHRVLELAYEHMNEPELLKVETENVTSDHVRQSVYYPANEEKLRLLAGLLRQYESGRLMVFANTRAAADLVERTLNANGIHAAAISGRVPQKKRQDPAYASFTTAKSPSWWQRMWPPGACIFLMSPTSSILTCHRMHPITCTG